MDGSVLVQTFPGPSDNPDEQGRYFEEQIRLVENFLDELRGRLRLS